MYTVSATDELDRLLPKLLFPMKNMFYFLMLALLTITFTSCPDETTLTLPVSEIYKMSFVVDGEPQTLNGLPTTNSNSLTPGREEGQGALWLNSVSADRSITLTLVTYDLPIVETADNRIELATSGFFPATITVDGEEMEGSIYCPHAVSTGRVQYDALIAWDSYEDGVMKGRFMGDPGKDNPVELTDGAFELLVPAIGF